MQFHFYKVTEICGSEYSPCCVIWLYLENSSQWHFFFKNLTEQKQFLMFPLSKCAFPLVRGEEETWGNYIVTGTFLFYSPIERQRQSSWTKMLLKVWIIKLIFPTSGHQLSSVGKGLWYEGRFYTPSPQRFFIVSFKGFYTAIFYVLVHSTHMYRTSILPTSGNILINKTHWLLP